MFSPGDPTLSIQVLSLPLKFDESHSYPSQGGRVAAYSTFYNRRR